MLRSEVPRLELNTIRGIACVALVAYHVVGPSPDNGMHLPEGSAWRHAMNSLDFLRMPTFATLSGFLYAGRRADARQLGEFFRKKAARLLVPLIFATIVMFHLRRMVYGDDTDFAHALLHHYQHLWFLQALILIFAAVALWDAFARPGWVALSAAAFAAVMISRSFEVTQFLSLSGALYLIPFFAFGMILRMQPLVLQQREVLQLAGWLVAIVLLLQQLTTHVGGTPIGRNSVAATVCGLGAGYVMFAACPRVPLLERIGTYGFSIYLWHSIASSSVRQGMAELIELPTAVEFGVLLAVGIAVPMLIQMIVRPIPVACLLVAGMRSPQQGEIRRPLSILSPQRDVAT